jgi:hypothetical protein
VACFGAAVGSHPFLQKLELSQAAVAEALKGARAVIVTGKLGPHLLPLATAAGVEHIVLPSLAGENGAYQPHVCRGSHIRCIMHDMHGHVPISSERVWNVGGQQGAFAFLGPDAALSDAKQEAEVAACGIPHTIVRAGALPTVL